MYTRSPKYHNKSTLMHDALCNATIYSCHDIRTKLVIGDPEAGVEAFTSKVSVIVRNDDQGLRFYLPGNNMHEKRCLRNRLPEALINELQIFKNGAENFVSMLLNDLDQGTDEIIYAESIPHCDSWLEKTVRPPPQVTIVTTETIPNSFGHPSPGSVSRQVSSNDIDNEQLLFASDRTTNFHHIRRISAQIPATVDHVVDAPGYWRILEHARSQAVGVVWRAQGDDSTLSSTITQTVWLENLRRSQRGSTDLSSYDCLFGSDGLSKYRLGAVGELFVSCDSHRVVLQY